LRACLRQIKKLVEAALRYSRNRLRGHGISHYCVLVSQDAGAPAAAGVSGPAGAVCLLSELMKCKVFGHRRCMLSGCCQLRPCRGRCFHGRCCRASGGMTAQAGCNLNAFVRYHERLQLIPISADAAGKRRRKPSAKGSDSAAHKAKRARRGARGASRFFFLCVVKLHRCDHVRGGAVF
jgi:hypothetical protein